MHAERKRMAYFLLVLAGVWVAHELGYLVAHPDPLLRAAALGGHAYLQLARALLTPVAAVALGGLAVQKAREARVEAGLSPIRLAGWQALTFIVIEVVERVPHGLAQTVLHEPAIYVGLALTAPIAALLVWLVGATARVVAAVFGSGRQWRPTATQHRWIPIGSFHSSSTAPSSSLGIRGPPSLALNH
jgi:hypothetical protein